MAESLGTWVYRPEVAASICVDGVEGAGSPGLDS